ncbi:hypothetical protein ADUPG1_003192, partial [Aduncisulcus paluster]
NHADTVSRRVSVLSPLSEYVSVSCDVDTMSSTLMTSVPCSLWHNALSDDGPLSHNAMMMLGLVSLFRALHDGCDDALSDGHLHDIDMNNGLRKCTMHESIRQVTCKMSDVSKTTTALHPALALESSSVCPRYIMEQCVAPIPPVPCASTLLARVKMLECLARDVAPCVSASNVAC